MWKAEPRAVPCGAVSLVVIAGVTPSGPGGTTAGAGVSPCG